jgi:hypothetical protein
MRALLVVGVILGLGLSLGCKSEKKKDDDSADEGSSKKKKRSKKSSLQESAKDGFGGILGEDGFNVFADLDDPDGSADGALTFRGSAHSPYEPEKFSAGWVGKEAAIVLRRARERELSSRTVVAGQLKCLVFDEGGMVRRLMVTEEGASLEYAYDASGRIILWFGATQSQDQLRRLAFFHRNNDLKLFQAWEGTGSRRTEPAPAGLRQEIFAASNRCLDAFGASNPRAGQSSAPPPPPAPIQPTPAPADRPAAVLPMEGTPYTIVAKHSGMCLEVAQGSVEAGAAIVQAACDGSAHQRFKLWVQEQGVMLAVDHTGMCVSIVDVSGENEARAVQWSCAAGANQTFNLQSLGGAEFRLAANHSKRCLDVAQSSTSPAANVIQFDCHENDNQRYLFKPAG